MDSAQPIIVKKVKKNPHGHHGGAWKVAFADFVTAMMAFFMLMWLMESTTPEERAAISDYFQNPSAIQGPGGASTSMIKLGSVDQHRNKSRKAESTHAEQPPPPLPINKEVKEVEVKKDQQRLENLQQELKKAIDQSQALKPFKDQLLLDITPEGLRIQIIDKEGRPMFDSGSATLKSYTKAILHEIAKLINKVPNRISLTGHTDATPYSTTGGYSNWELSADRANASRRALIAGGLSEAKVAKVEGLASTVPFIKSDPRNPMNRRISLIVLNKMADAAIRNDAVTPVNTAHGVKQALDLHASQASTMEGAVTGREGSSPATSSSISAPTQTPTALPTSPEASGNTASRSARYPRKLELKVLSPVSGNKTAHTHRKSDDEAHAPVKIQPIRPIKPIQLPMTNTQ